MTGNPFPSRCGSKDVNRARRLDGSVLWGTGDVCNSGADSNLYSYDAARDLWAVVVPACVPASVSPIVLNHPSDRGPMIEDSRSDIWYRNSLPFPPDEEGQPCGPGGAIQRLGLLKWAKATGQWEYKGGPGSSLGGGAYDSAADAMLHFESSGDCVGQLIVTTLATLAQQAFDLCLRPSPAWSGETGGWLTPQSPHRVFFGWDNARRKLYAVVPVRRVDQPGNTVEVRLGMFVFDRVTNTWAMKTHAPVAPPLDQDTSYMAYFTWVDFDSKNNKVIYPYTTDGPCGTVTKMLVYDPPSDSWEAFAAPAGVHGNSMAYDAKDDVTIMAGQQFCAGGDTNSLWLWRY